MFTRFFELTDLLRHHGRRRSLIDAHALGRRGEDLAHRFLQRAGMIVAGRNYRMGNGPGEIDLIGWEADTLVFIEVKTRRTDDYGAPDRAIGPEKERAMLRAARDYARHASVDWDKVRFDVIGIVMSVPPVITHLRDVLAAR